MIFLDVLSLFSKNRSGNCSAPVKISLPAVKQATGIDQSPVRIVVDCRSGSYRQERLFVWSIHHVRDPSRCYEIYLLKDETDRSGMYQAITKLNASSGRVIVNTLSQLYLDDPGILTHCDMHGNAVLAYAGDTPDCVLLDCEKISQIGADKFQKILGDNSLVGQLSENWQCQSVRLKNHQIDCIYHNRDNNQLIDTHSLLTLEQSADNARFTLFNEQSPSSRYQELLGFYETMHAQGRPDTGHNAKQTFSGVSLSDHIHPVAHVIKQSNAKTVLDFGSGKGKLYQQAPGFESDSRFKTMSEWGDVVVACYDPGYEPFATPVEGQFDVVISTDVVEHIPEQDIPWVLDKIFAYARQSVYVVAACYPALKQLPDGSNAHCTLQPPEWWLDMMQQSARHFPEINWVLCTQEKGWLIFQRRKKLRKKGMRDRYFSGKHLNAQECASFSNILF